MNEAKMIKELAMFAILLAAGMMIYDIHKEGGFFKSELYKFLEENGVVEYGETFVAELKTFYNQAMRFNKDGKPAPYDEMCMDFQAFIDLFYNSMLVCKNSVTSVCENSCRSLNKSFPNAMDDISMLVSEILTSTKQGLETLTSHLQNFALSAVNYANEVLNAELDYMKKLVVKKS